MAFLDVLGPPAIGNYYRKLAKMTSLDCSVYMTEILDISATVLRKKKFDENGYFRIDRRWVEDRTTICLADQLDYDSTLQNMGVLEVSADDKNKIRLHLNVFADIMINDADDKKVEIVKKTVKLSRSQQAANKKAGQIIMMKKLLSESDIELRMAYESWVESVYASGKGFLTKDKIKMFENAINSYTSDKNVKLLVIQAGIETGYTEPSWVINRYESNRKSGAKTTTTKVVEQRTVTGVRSDVEF